MAKKTGLGNLETGERKEFGKFIIEREKNTGVKGEGEKFTNNRPDDSRGNQAKKTKKDSAISAQGGGTAKHHLGGC